MTGGFVAMRVCERFGIRPFGASEGSWGGLTDAQRRLLLAYEDVRQQQESRSLAP